MAKKAKSTTKKRKTRSDAPVAVEPASKKSTTKAGTVKRKKVARPLAADMAVLVNAWMRPTLVADTDGCVLFVNEPALKLLDCEEKKLLGLPLPDKSKALLEANREAMTWRDEPATLWFCEQSTATSEQTKSLTELEAELEKVRKRAAKAESRVEQAEAKLEEAASQQEVVEAALAQVQAAEARVEQAMARANQAEKLAEKAVTRSEKAEERIFEAINRAEQSEARVEAYESRLDQALARADEAAARAGEIEEFLEEAEARCSEMEEDAELAREAERAARAQLAQVEAELKAVRARVAALEAEAEETEESRQVTERLIDKMEKMVDRSRQEVSKVKREADERVRVAEAHAAKADERMEHAKLALTAAERMKADEETRRCEAAALMEGVEGKATYHEKRAKDLESQLFDAKRSLEMAQAQVRAAETQHRSNVQRICELEALVQKHIPNEDDALLSLLKSKKNRGY